MKDRVWVEVVYHEHRGGAGRARMWLDELPVWLDKFWDTGRSRMVEQIIVLRPLFLQGDENGHRK